MRIETRSSSASFDVAWRSTASDESARAHALAVVGHANKSPPAAVGEDIDAARPGIERVFDQFLDHAGRSLDHLARGDAIDGGFRELADGHGP